MLGSQAQEEVIRMYQERIPQKTIAAKLGCSLSTIERCIKGAGIPKNEKLCLLEPHKEEIVNKYKSGIGSDSLAKEYGCSSSKMLRFLKKHTEVKKESPVIDLLNSRRQEIIDRYLSGESTYALAKVFETQDAMIYLYLRDKCGIEMRSNNEKKFDQEKGRVEKLYGEGKTIAAISQEVGCGLGTAGKWTRQLGLDSSRYSSQREIALGTQAKEIVADYLDGIGCDLLAAKYDCSSSSILQLLKANNIETGLYSRTHNVDFDYFKQIDSWDKAYILGWLITDGNNSRSQFLRLSITDSGPVLYMKRMMKSDAEIILVNRTSSHGTKYKTIYQLNICSVEICKDIAKFGVVPNKTHKTYYPDIPKEFDHAMILGAFEGDGSIVIRPSNVRGYTGVISWAGNIDFLLGIKNKIKENLGLDMNIYDCLNSKPNIKVIRSQSTDDAIKILDWLYEGKQYCLKRKYRRYLKLKGLI